MSNPTPDEIAEAKKWAGGFTLQGCPEAVHLLAALEAAEKERDGMRELYTILVENAIALEDRATRAEAERDKLRKTLNSIGWS